VQPKGHIHTPRSARECEEMSSYTPKWVPTLGVGDSRDSQIFGERFDGSKDWIEKLLKYRCLKWFHMIHLNTYNISYGQKKVGSQSVNLTPDH
jgi:hypothetical protein